MRFRGEGFECGQEYEISDAVLTRERLSLDWREEGEVAHLEASSSDGILFSGTYGYPRPEASRQMELTLFKAKDGQVLLFGRWLNVSDGKEGRWLVHLRSDKASHS